MTVGPATRFAVIGEGTALAALHRALTDTVLPASTIAFVDQPAPALTTKFDCLPARLINHDDGRAALVATQVDWLISACNYDYMVSRKTLDLFGGQTLNLHFGALPAYAGRNGYQWAIRNGETQTAVTLHRMTFPFDSGEICAVGEIPIGPEDTGFTIYRRCMKDGISLLAETITNIRNGAQPRWRPQPDAGRRGYLEADVGDGKIDWTQTSAQILDYVRAADFGPFDSPGYAPSAHDTNGLQHRVQKVSLASTVVKVPFDGCIHEHDGKHFARTADGVIEIVSMTPMVINHSGGEQ